MTEVPGGWGTAAPGWPPAEPLPSSRPGPAVPSRPAYREPHAISAGPLIAGAGATMLWFALFGAIGRDLATYAWWTVAAAVSAWLVATFLALFGDRGVAVGVAVASGLGLSLALGLVGERWITTEDWPLW